MPNYTAKTADKHKLYEKAVQCVSADIDFVEETYKAIRGRKPRLLREDFCGTAAAAVEFVKRNKKNRAIAIDLDEDVLDYGRKRHVPKLKKRTGDIDLIHANVLDVQEPAVDALLAMNFSYFCFKTRDELKRYFANCHASLGEDGMLFMDAYGGWEAYEPMEEEKELKGFTYVWDQDTIDAITGEVVNYIHFRFPDGTKMKKAFTYEWRLWSLPEITELLTEAGFRSADVYWEGWDDEEEEGDGTFTLARTAPNCAGWICYIVGVK